MLYTVYWIMLLLDAFAHNFAHRNRVDGELPAETTVCGLKTWPVGSAQPSSSLHLIRSSILLSAHGEQEARSQSNPALTLARASP